MSKSKSKSFFRASTRLLVTTALLFGSFFALTKAVWADPTPPGTIIDNAATGSFTGETSNTTDTVTSNTVTLTVLEVAGITVQSTAVTEAPSSVTNAGTFQGVAGINTGDVVYFDFTVTNVGNDPTKFFIPNNAQISGGTLQGNIQIIAVDPDGAAGTFLPNTFATPVNVTTGDDTVTLLGATTGATDGYIPVNGTVTVRVPVKVTQATVGQPVIVILGDTGANDNSAATQNQAYIASTPITDLDVYTVDLADGTAKPVTYIAPVSQVPEAAGNPANGDTTNRRQEASDKVSVNVVASPLISGYKSVKLTNDADSSSSITPTDTLTWRVSYANTGTVDVTNFQITDVLPAGLTLSGTLAPSNITVNGTQALEVTPSPNTSYNGTGNNTLFASGVTFKAGGVITVDIPVTINTGVTDGTTFSNQPTATSTDLPAAGVKTDNIDNTNTSLPTDVTVPANSIVQNQTTAIDPTIAKTYSASNPKLLLVKRITAVNGVAITTVVNDGVALSADDNVNWVTGYLQGDITRNDIKPGDRLEYTIYFLSAGDVDITNVSICDLIPPYTTFQNNAYDVVGAGSNLGMVFANSTPITYLTGLFDSDRGQFYPAGSLPPSTCKQPTTNNALTAADNTDGLVVVNVVSTPTTLPKATGAGTPTNSYGFVRFQVQVK